MRKCDNDGFNGNYCSFLLANGFIISIDSNQGLLVIKIKAKLCSAMCNQVLYVLCLYQAQIIG